MKLCFIYIYFYKVKKDESTIMDWGVVPLGHLQGVFNMGLSSSPEDSGTGRRHDND